MSKNCRVTDDVEALIHQVIKKHKLDPVFHINYFSGSETGDGYASATAAVTIAYHGGTLELFIKSALNLKSNELLPIEKLYVNEIYFYDKVYDAYTIFLESKNSRSCFNYVPKCYGTRWNVLALEDLRSKGFTLFNRNHLMNDAHVKLVLTTFAKFHAISFCFKDQRREEYETLVKGTYDFFSDQNEEAAMTKMLQGMVKNCLDKMDPIKDKKLLDRCKVDNIVTAFNSAGKNLDEYSILTQGDCWCNNMMFLYENDNIEKPIDIMLIDWQLLRPASPIYDISYFFFSVASKEILDNTKYYLRFYYDVLTSQILALGGDPSILYPFNVFMGEWRRHCKYGFSTAFMIVKIMLSAKDETIDLEKIDFDKEEELQNLHPKFEKEDKYMDRIRILADFMIRNDYI